MSVRPCPTKNPCADDFGNYTTEDPDQNLFCVQAFFADTPPPGWNAECTVNYVTNATARCCRLTYTDAFNCARRAAQEAVWTTWRDPNCDPLVIYQNVEKIGVALCDDGSVFTSVVAAGTYIGRSQEEVDALAQSQANKQANELKFCCPPNDVCCCVDESFSRLLTVEGGTGPFTWAPVAGSWPIGIDLSETAVGNRAMLIAGTPLFAGTSVISYTITDPSGNFLTKTFTVHAIDISDTSLPGFEIGVPYSHQMTAVGGTGNYAWRIDSGTLPAGLTMTVGGLIVGTPTASTTANLTFSVIDLACQSADRTFFPPQIGMTGTSTTTIATVRGFDPYIQSSTPPKRYKKLAWTGTSEQTAVATANNASAGGAKYIWSGVSEIDTSGAFLSRYRKDYYTQCPTDLNPPTVVSSPNFGLSILKGYCYTGDPNSCPICPTPYPFKDDFATNSTNNVTDFLNDPSSGIHTTTALTLTNVSSTVQLIGISGVTNFPQTTINGVLGNWVTVTGLHNYSATLSEEFTDSDALAGAQIIVSNALVTQARPRTTGYVSTWTTAIVHLACSNLIVGESYSVSVEFWDSNGTHVDQAYSFIATSVTHLIEDSIPTPADGHTIEARNPRINFA